MICARVIFAEIATFPGGTAGITVMVLGVGCSLVLGGCSPGSPLSLKEVSDAFRIQRASFLAKHEG